MASNTTRVIALGALTGLGLVAALGAGNSGSVTPGPQSFTVASPLTKTGTLVGLGDPGQNKGWVGHDGGWSAVNVVTRVTPSYPLENAGTLAAPIIAFNESDCTGDGFGWVYDQGTWTCLPVVVGGAAACPGNEPLVGDDAGYRCGGQITTGNLTAGHIYTDAGIAANAVAANSIDVASGKASITADGIVSSNSGTGVWGKMQTPIIGALSLTSSASFYSVTFQTVAGYGVESYTDGVSNSYLTTTYAGDYLVAFSVSFTAGAASRVYTAAPSYNGGVMDGCQVQLTSGGTGLHNLSGSCVLHGVLASKAFRLVMASGTNSDSVTPSYANLAIQRL